MFQSDSLFKVATEYQAALNLIDVIFPLESCLHHQFVPLELQENCLTVGMVNPQDWDAIQHINLTATSSNYSFQIQSLEPKIHQLILAAYIKLGSKKSQAKILPPQTKHLDKSATLFDIPSEAEVLPPQTKHLDKSATLFDIPSEAEILPPQTKHLDKSATLFDIPSEAEVLPPQTKHLDKSATLFDVNIEEKKDLIANELSEKETFIISNQQKKSHDTTSKSQIFFGEPQINNLPQENVATNNQQPRLEKNSALDAKPNQIEQSIAKFQNLPSKQLLYKLLAIVSQKETGELDLQQHHHYGRIVYSYNGSAQSAIEKLPLIVFEEINQELKKIAKLPLKKIVKTQKVAVYKNYQGVKILLTINFTLGKFGEEAKVQILKGKALQLHEQKQSDKTLDRAIDLGQKLEKALKRITLRQQSLSVSELNSLKTVIKKIEQQIELLKFQ